MQESPVILLAEDDDGHALLVRNGLKKAGFHNRVVRFCDGEEALGFLTGPDGPPRIPAPVVLMLDIRMPKMDGIEVLRRIRANNAFDSMPVVMVTTMDDPGEMEKCRQLGCNSYIVKPVDWKLFSVAVRDITGLLSPREWPVSQN
jgi:CheY-like chemotaxis protein